MNSDFLPLHRSWFGAEEEREILETLRSGWLSTGPRTKEFEERFAEYRGARHAIALNSCSAGLHLSYILAGIGSGDEVIMSPVTYAATANYVVHQGARPVFVDIDPETFNIDPARIEEKITERTKAIVPVHIAGHPCDMNPIMSIANRHGLTVIEDAAHATESEYRGRKIGTFGSSAAFSFYVTKNITTGEGGALITNDDELAERARVMRLHGMNRNAWSRLADGDEITYQIVAPGFKYNMSDLQAALGLHQLAKVGMFLERRDFLWKTLSRELHGTPGIITPAEKGNIRHARHLYIIRVTGMKRDDFHRELRRRDIGAGIHFISLHLQPFYQEKFGYRRGDFPVAEAVSDTVLSLPFFPKMTDEDLERVVEAVKDIVEK